MILICISLMVNEYLFVYLLATYLSFFGKMSIHVLCLCISWVDFFAIDFSSSPLNINPILAGIFSFLLT